LNRDQKFFDRYSLVLGILGAVTIALIAFALKLSDMTQGVYTRDGEEYQAAVGERIRPFGAVYLPGEEHTASSPIVATAPEPEPVATTMSGPQVYNSACIACHATGVGGAPVVGDAGAWTPRIAQGADTLNDHAVNGFTGSVGFMPAKGARLDLSDGEIHAAVEYMVGESL
jgi:cytochrome c5